MNTQISETNMNKAPTTANVIMVYQNVRPKIEIFFNIFYCVSCFSFKYINNRYIYTYLDYIFFYIIVNFTCIINHIGGVMVRVLGSNEVDRGF